WVSHDYPLLVIGWIGVCCDKRALGRFLCVFCPVAGVGGVLVPVHACTACNGLLLSSSFF
ncbi:hypothetical protein, partial [Moraxella catarrhalis]|uniref:hypothetical protein n=1 Tax=Moraxella catarrhalis TaxID=480 RepID=UPI00128CF407